MNRRDFLLAAGSAAGWPFILNCDCNDVDNAAAGAPKGKRQEFIRDWYRRAFAAGAGVFVADVMTGPVVETKDTPTGEVIGARFPEDVRKGIRWYQTVEELSAQGTDVLHLACEEGRKAGAIVLGGARMSDAHHGARWQVQSDNPLFPKIVMDHPEWCNTWEDSSLDATLNFAVPEVQAHWLALLREMATNYDVDGIELNWMRWCRHFPHGKQREYLDVLTHFVHDVHIMLRDVARKKGREKLILGHRVAATLDECLNIGCDVATWAKKGYADYLAPMDFLFTDLNLRTDEFVTAVEGTDCLVYPSLVGIKYSFGRIYDNRDLYEGKDNHRAITMRSLAQFRAAAHNFYTWGADGGSSFNMYMWPPLQQEFYTQVISIFSSAKEATAGPRYYIYLPIWKDHGGGVGPTGRHNAQSLTFNADTIGRRQAFTFRMADGRNGEKIDGTLRFRIYDATPQDEFEIDLNGEAIPAERFDIEYQPQGEQWDEPTGEGTIPTGEQSELFEKSVPFSWPPNLRFEIPLVDCPPFRGDNELGITLVKKNPAADKAPVMEALEVQVSG